MFKKLFKKAKGKKSKSAKENANQQPADPPQNVKASTSKEEKERARQAKREAEFYDACETSDIPAIEQLTSTNIDIGAVPPGKQLSGAVRAAWRGREEVINVLLRNPHTRAQILDQYPFIICFAVEGGHINIVRSLIEAGISVNEVEGKRNTPLHTAAAHGKVELVEMLLKAGASTDRFNQLGKTAKQTADAKGYSNIAKMIMDSKKEVQEQRAKDREQLRWENAFATKEGYTSNVVLRWD